MSRLSHTLHNLKQRKARVRAVVSGTPQRPRLTVSISNRHVSAQIIDDSAHKTLVSATTVGLKDSGTMTERAEKLAVELAKRAKAKKIKHVAFDRNGRLYHGRVRAFADSARREGLEF